jgi:hypothetical protein
VLKLKNSAHLRASGQRVNPSLLFFNPQTNGFQSFRGKGLFDGSIVARAAAIATLKQVV